jgi:hypothetical protein
MIKSIIFILCLSAINQIVFGMHLKYPERDSDAHRQTQTFIIVSDELKREAQLLEKQLLKQNCKVKIIASKDAAKGRCKGLKEQYKDGNVIFIGGLECNDALSGLYSRFMTNADTATPGKGGLLMQYIPRCYGPASSALIVSGSSKAGTIQAVNKLTEAIKSGKKIDQLRLYDLKSYVAINYKKSAIRNATRAMNPRKTWKNFYLLSEAHRLTGDKKYLDAFIKSAEKFAEIKDNHYGMGLLVRGWDYWARSGLVDAKLIRRLDQIFLNYLVNEQNSWWRRKESKAVFADNRHHVYGTWGYYQVAQALYRGLNPLQREKRTGKFIKEKIDESERWFAACCRDFRPAVLSIGMVINMTLFELYSIQSGDDWLFKSGAAAEYVKLAAAVTDNTGGSIGISGYEDTYPGAWKSNYSVGPMVNMAAYYYRSENDEWLKKHLAGWGNSTWWQLGSDNHAWSVGIKSVASKNSIGFQSVFGDKHPLYLAFRSGFASKDLYFCVTGSGTDDINTGDSGKGRQVYPNMIARLSWQEIPWLVTNTNLVTPINRNALTVDSPSVNDKIKTNMRLEFSGHDQKVYFASCIAQNYCGVDWTRAFIVCDNDFLFVKDSITAGSSGQYAVAVTWRSPFAAKLNSNGTITFQADGKKLNLLSVARSKVTAEVVRAKAKQGALTPYIVRQYFAPELKQGGNSAIYNLFYTGQKNYDMKIISSDVIGVRNIETGKITFFGFGSCKIGKIEVKAKFFVLTDSSFAALDGVLKIAGKVTIVKKYSGELKYLLNDIWNGTESLSLKPETKAANAEVLWSFSGFSGSYPELTGFSYRSPSAVTLNNAFDGNIKRYKLARWPKGKKLDISIEFDDYVELRQVAMLYYSDNGRKQRYKRLPVKAKPVTIYNTDKKLKVNTKPYFELDETYKGSPFTYTGALAELHTKGRKFRIVADARSLYAMRLFGGMQKCSKIIDVLEVGNKKIVVRNSQNEIACLDAASGKCLWLEKSPFEIRRWTFNKNIIALACSDSTIKGIDASTGKQLWSVDTTVIPLGIPYDVAPFKDGFIYSSYYHMNPITKNGKLLDPKQNYLPGMWLYNVMGNIDLNGDGCSDAISRALWGHVNLYDGKTGRIDYFANLRGRLVDWKVLSGKDNKPDLLVVCRDGVGLYNAHIRKKLLGNGFVHVPDEDALLIEKRSQREIWSEKFNSQIVASNVFAKQIVLAFKTGMIRSYDLEGRLCNIFYAGGPVSGMAVAGKFLCVNIGTAILLLDKNFKCIKNIECKNYGFRVVSGDIGLIFVYNGIERIKLN